MTGAKLRILALGLQAQTEEPGVTPEELLKLLLSAQAVILNELAALADERQARRV